MDNIFVVGSEVRGESQIGYKRYIDKLTNVLSNNSNTNNISITGLKRFGKTSLAKEVIERVKEKSDKNLITIYVNLAKQHSFSDLLVSIINILYDEIIENKQLMEDPVFKIYADKLEKADPLTITYRNSFDGIFKYITKQDFRVILAIDEFDSASNLFKETADFEFIRDLSSNRDIGISLVLVSRRQLYMIEKKNFNNSTFHGIVQTYPIDGFDENDFACFFQLLKDKYDIVLSEYEEDRLRYYCGRSPYLISMFAYDVVEDFARTGHFDIDAIFRNRQIDINNYYKSIFACLENDKISVDGVYKEAGTLEKLVGIIIGPRIGIVEEDIEVLESMGYLYYEGDIYYSISMHFTNALRRKSVFVDTWDAILNLEKAIKNMIRYQIMKKYDVEYIDYDIYTEVFEKSGNSSIMQTYDKFISQSMCEYKVDVDMLDVCSLKIAVSILECYWTELFAQFFDNDNWEKWEGKLELCAEARNPIAHGHEDFLSAETKMAVEAYCSEIMKLLKKNNACVSIKTILKIDENNKKAEANRRYYNLNYSNADLDIVDRYAEMTAAVQYAKGIKGYFELDGKYYKCSINKKRWNAEFNDDTEISKYLGKQYKIYIRSVDVNQNSIQVEFYHEN